MGITVIERGAVRKCKALGRRVRRAKWTNGRYFRETLFGVSGGVIFGQFSHINGAVSSMESGRLEKTGGG